MIDARGGASEPQADRPTSGASPAPPTNGHRTDGQREDLTERVIATDVIRRGRYLEFRVETVERADGSRTTRDIVGHPGAVAIVAIDEEDRVLLVRQFRVAAREALLEIPAGTLNVDAATGRIEDPNLAAARELEEETGYRARSWRRLAGFWTAPGFATEFMHLYLATDLFPAVDDRLGPEVDEHLELERVPRAQAIAAAERGELRDAKSLLGMLWLAHVADSPKSAAAPTAPGAHRAVEAEFVLRMSDIIAANMALSRSSRVVTLWGALIFAAGILPLLAGNLLLALPALVVGLATMFGVVAVPVIWYRLRRRPELLDQMSRVAVDDQGLRYESPFGSGTYPWAAFKRVREVGGFVFFDTGIGPSLFVPVAAFRPDALSHFRRLLLAAGFSQDGHPIRPG